jgi:hypothetical protein
MAGFQPAIHCICLPRAMPLALPKFLNNLLYIRLLAKL